MSQTVREVHGKKKRACKVANQKYFNAPNWYPVVHFKFRGRNCQAQLSHPPGASDVPCRCLFIATYSTVTGTVV